jgi:hypothetical protein
LIKEEKEAAELAERRKEAPVFNMWSKGLSTTIQLQRDQFKVQQTAYKQQNNYSQENKPECWTERKIAVQKSGAIIPTLGVHSL